jgi:GntR family transcriptional repressor for pyruvate dehydrogenase complex
VSTNGSSAAFGHLQPAQTKRACEVIFEQVRGLIASGELKPGDRLPSERNMMEMFHRSRPTIREALRMLERSGYIRTVAGSNGAIVMELNNRYLQQTMQDALEIGNISLAEMCEYRLVSEDATVAWAAQRATEEDVAALRDVVEKMEALIDQGDYVAFIDLDPVFHGLLAVAAKNQVSMTMNQTFSKLYREFMKGTMDGLTREARVAMAIQVQTKHREICEAIAAHDVEAARKAMADHLDDCRTELRDPRAGSRRN